MVICWLLIDYLNGYLSGTCWLLNIGSKNIEDMVSISNPIAFRYSILLNLILCDCHFIDHKKRFPGNQLVT
jgi:hypothetical protein